MTYNWAVHYSRKAEKQYRNLKRSGARPSINDAIDLLVFELELYGPDRTNWPNYGKLSERSYHCHLKKGKPTYVACWTVVSARLKQIEVYYVGTHEGAPY